MAAPQAQEETDDEDKEPKTFLSLPAEIRNYIYELSGCLTILQCRKCHSTVQGDSEDVNRPCCWNWRHEEDKWEFREKAYLWVWHTSSRDLQASN